MEIRHTHTHTSCSFLELDIIDQVIYMQTDTTKKQPKKVFADNQTMFYQLRTWLVCTIYLWCELVENDDWKWCENVKCCRSCLEETWLCRQIAAQTPGFNALQRRCRACDGPAVLQWLMLRDKSPAAPAVTRHDPPADTRHCSAAVRRHRQYVLLHTFLMLSGNWSLHMEEKLDKNNSLKTRSCHNL